VNRDHDAGDRPPPTRLSRRSLLKRGGLLALAGAGAGTVLDACSSSSSTLGLPASFKIASPTNPVTWPIPSDNRPIASGKSPEQGATLQLYNYSDYIDPNALKSFEKKYKSTGVQVSVSTFNDEDEALAKLRSGQVNFDIYFPSYDAIGKLTAAGLVQPINHSYIPNITSVWPEFQNPFYDQGWRYSVPYTIYTTGIGWRADKAPADIASMPNPYDVFWDKRFAHQIAILDDYRSAMAMVLLRNGITDINTGNPAHLALVQRQLLQMQNDTHPKVDVTDYTDIPSGVVSTSQAWSGDMINALGYLSKGESPDILRYWFPPDGKGEVDNDLMVVLKTSQAPVLAHLFLNHMLEFDVAYKNFQSIGYQPPQTQINPERLIADSFIPKELTSAVVLPKYFDVGYRTLELRPPVDEAWHSVWQVFKAGS
jgi:spermidine/putrescine transport system substrate-binding protein